MFEPVVRTGDAVSKPGQPNKSAAGVKQLAEPVLFHAAFLGHHFDPVRAPRGVPRLVVVPRHNLQEPFVEFDTDFGVEDGIAAIRREASQDSGNRSMFASSTAIIEGS